MALVWRWASLASCYAGDNYTTNSGVSAAHHDCEALGTSFTYWSYNQYDPEMTKQVQRQTFSITSSIPPKHWSSEFSQLLTRKSRYRQSNTSNPLKKSELPLIQCSSGPQESPPQAGSRSVQPCLHSKAVQQTDRRQGSSIAIACISWFRWGIKIQDTCTTLMTRLWLTKGLWHSGPEQSQFRWVTSMNSFKDA